MIVRVKRAKSGLSQYLRDGKKADSIYNRDDKEKSYKLQEKPNYPKQTNEHNALADAIFCRDLYKFLNTL